MPAPRQMTPDRVIADPQNGRDALARGHQVVFRDTEPCAAGGVQRCRQQRLHGKGPVPVARGIAPRQILALPGSPLAQLSLSGLGSLFGQRGAQRIRCHTGGDIAAGVASDALGSALAEQAAEAAEAELRQWAARQGKYLTGRYSPGYGDWPLAVQPLLAAALDTARRAGLCVTENNLMTPRKSITAILGVSDHPVRGHLAGCGHCVLRTRCEYRKRGITCASE